MFKDAEKALREFEAELLAMEAERKQATQKLPAQEETEEQLFTEEWLTEEASGQEPDVQEFLTDEELDALLAQTQTIGQTADYRNHSNDYGAAVQAYNTDRTELDPETLSEELETEDKKVTTGLIATALLLSAGIVGVVVWWIIRYWGVF